MNKPNTTDRPNEPGVQPQPAEPDFTQPSSDEATRLPLPGELHEPQPPLGHEVREPAAVNPPKDMPESSQRSMVDARANP
ncbi:hypothetical protein D9M68_638850 [compost metagenome]